MNKQQALQAFWEGFGIPAYCETSVPDDAVLPYLTYEVATSDFDRDVPLAASLWYRSASWAGITEKCNEIERAIGRGGALLKYDGGAFWVRKGGVWAQRMQEPGDDMVRRVLMNISIEYLE